MTSKQERIVYRGFLTTVILGTGLLLASVPVAAERAEVMAPKIVPEQFDKLRALIKPLPGGYDDIPWMTDLWEARKKAAAEGKPLLVWVGDGHPLGWT
jgi:hypothetical protein